jgi:hypothetical protein
MTQVNKSNHSLGTRTTTKTFWVSIILFILSLIMLSNAVSIQKQTKESLRTAEPQSSAEIGHEINFGSVSMSVESITTSQGGGPFKAPENQEFIIATIHIKNRSEKPIQIYPVSDTYIKDGSGNVYYEAPYGLTSPFRSGELLPGEEIRGELSYLAPKNSSVVYYVDSGWSGGVVKISLR